MSTQFNENFNTNDVIEADHIKQVFDPINQLESGEAFFRLESGSAVNAYKLLADQANPVSAYTAGLRVAFKAAQANNGAATLELIGPAGALGPKALVNADGSALTASDIQAGQMLEAIYDGSQFFIISESKSGSGSSSGGGGSISGTPNKVGRFDGSGNLVGGSINDDSQVVQIGDGSGYHELHVPGAGNSSLNIGPSSNASGNNSIALGNAATASQASSIAIGKSSSANGLDSFAIGDTASAAQQNCLALGSDTLAGKAGAIAIGNQATSHSRYSLALGFNAEAGNPDNQYHEAIAIGESTISGNSNSIAIGNHAEAQSVSTAIGFASSSEINSVAVGYGATSESSAVSIGKSAQATGISIGQDSKSLTSRSIALGGGAEASGVSSVAFLGKNSKNNSVSFGASGSPNNAINNLYLGRGAESSQSQYVAAKVTATDAQGADVKGGRITLAGGQGTGTGEGGDVKIATAPAGSTSGSDLNAHKDRLKVTAQGNLQIFDRDGEEASYPGNGVTLYSEPQSGYSELKVRDEAGNITTLSPHNFSLFDPDPEAILPWSYYSKNPFLGLEINVDMYKLVKLVEDLTGIKLIHTRELPEEECRDWDCEQRNHIHEDSKKQAKPAPPMVRQKKRK